MGVIIPSGLLEGGGWLCTVCCRGGCPDQERWSWLACEYCRAINHRAAALLGGRRILPLGAHSVMNGVSVPLSWGESPARDAAVEQMVAMGGEWNVLRNWRKSQIALMADRGGWVALGEQGVVDVDEWDDAYPDTVLAAAESFRAYLLAHRAWMIDIEPLLGDPAWLAEIPIP